jgi:hypothetical protein
VPRTLRPPWVDADRMEAAPARRRVSGAGSVGQPTTSDLRVFPLPYPLALRLSPAQLWLLARPAVLARRARQQVALARRAVSRPPAAEAAHVEALPAAALGRGAASPLPVVVAPRVVVPSAALAQEAAWRRPARAVVAPPPVAVLLVAALEQEAAWRRPAVAAARVESLPAAAGLPAAWGMARAVTQPAKALAQRRAVRPAEEAGVPGALPSPWAAAEQAAAAWAPAEVAPVQRRAGTAVTRCSLSEAVLRFRDCQAACPAVAEREERPPALPPLRERRRESELLGVFQAQLEARHLRPSAARWYAGGRSWVPAAAFRPQRAGRP